MESRFVLLLLAQAAVLAGLTGCGRQLEKTDASQPPVIEPDVARRDIKVAKIDSENFEVGFSAGELSIEDFGVNSVDRSALRVSRLGELLPRRCGRPNDRGEDELRDPERLCRVAHRFAAAVYIL